MDILIAPSKTTPSSVCWTKKEFGHPKVRFSKGSNFWLLSNSVLYYSSDFTSLLSYKLSHATFPSVECMQPQCYALCKLLHGPDNTSIYKPFF